MSQRRLLAFVSSRMAELAPERKIVKAELDKLHVDAWVFETDAGARAQSVQQTYLKEVEAADFYIGIFWTGYGEYTIEEFDHAYKLGKSCLVYEKRSNIEGRDPRLTAFLEKIGEVKGLVTIRWFETPEELGEHVKRDVAAWQTDIVRNAAAKSRGYAAPFQAPALGDQYVERTGTLDQLNQTLLALDDNGEPRVTRAALHGMGGSGKTIIATAFAHLDVVRKRFPDGVLYTTLGQNPDLKQRLSDWGHALHDPELPATGYIDPPSGTSRLRTLLNDKACLLIVDDVWEGDHARAFVVGGPQCLMLITTRISEIGEEIEALTIELAKMTPVEALRLVEKRSGAVAEVDRVHADWLMQEVEYLPLALELISAQVKKLGWEDYRRRWNSQKVKAVKRSRESSGRYDNLWDSLELSVEELSDQDQDRYFRLGVFQEDTLFPAAACARLWECSDDEAAEILVDFAGRALLHEQKEFKPRLYSFHDLLYKFVLDQLGSEGLQEANKTLVASYRSLCNGEWHKVPDDGYVFDHLTEHLQAAGWVDELYKLVSRDWMDVQFRRVHSHRAFATDLGTVCAAAQAETPANLFQIIQTTVVSATLGSLANRCDPEALAALAHIGEGDMALGHAELIQEPARKSRAYRLIAAALIGRGDSSTIQRVLQEALKAARSVSRATVRCPVLCDLAETIFEAGDVELAGQVAGEAESTARLETSDYYAPKLLIAAALAQDRVGNTEQSNEVALDALNLVENGQADMDQVLKLAHLLQLEALFEKSGNSERAEEIRAKLQALCEDINNKVNTDAYVYMGYADRLSAACLAIGDGESAAIIAERWMLRDWTAASALAQAADALIKSGAIDRGTQVLDESVAIVRETVCSEQFRREEEKRIATMGQVTAALGRLGREDVAIELADLAPDAEGRNHSLGTLALALAQRDLIDSARRAANASLTDSQQLIQDSSTQASWLAATAKALNKIGKKPEALEFSKRAMALAEDWNADTGREPWKIRLVADSLSEMGQTTGALKVIDRIDAFNAKAEGWIQVIRSPEASKEERVDLSKRVIAGVVDTKDANKTILLGRTARALAEVGLAVDAIRVGQLAVSSAAKIKDLNSGPAEGLCEAAHAFALTGRFKKARETIDSATAQRHDNREHIKSLKVHALNVLARALGDASKPEQALATMRFAQELIEQDHENNDPYSLQSEALIELGRTLTHLGKTDEARQANRRALELSLLRLKKLGA
jgi:tetratricopeptide (TPR) repeat protein